MCPFPEPLETLGELSHVRATLLASSMQTLRARGLFERYSELLDPAHRSAVLDSVAGEWLAVEHAFAHYTACDQLELSVDEQIAIGRDVSRRTHETFLGLLVKLARGVGVTPWVVMPKINSLGVMPESAHRLEARSASRLCAGFCFLPAARAHRDVKAVHCRRGARAPFYE